MKTSAIATQRQLSIRLCSLSKNNVPKKKNILLKHSSVTGKNLSLSFNADNLVHNSFVKHPINQTSLFDQKIDWKSMAS